jgi:hypothetical protein
MTFIDAQNPCDSLFGIDALTDEQVAQESFPGETVKYRGPETVDRTS